jgi:hypothetical protein
MQWQLGLGCRRWSVIAGALSIRRATRQVWEVSKNDRLETGYDGASGCSIGCDERPPSHVPKKERFLAFT